MILGGSRAGLVPEPLARYRVREGSLSTDRIGILAGGIRCLERAANRSDLGKGEQRTVERTLRSWHRNLRLAQARAALAGRKPGVQSQLAQIVVGRGYAPQTRLKAAAAAIVPGRARHALAASESAHWAGAAGVRVERKSGEPTS